MRGVRAASIGCAIALLMSFLLARAHPFGNAGLLTAKAEKPRIVDRLSIPPEVRATLDAKCADCHSMQTRLPIYDRLAVRFAPMSWLIERDIVDGRKAMNLDLWDTYSADQQQTLAAKIVQETRTHKMPLPQYRMIHRNAQITDADIQRFIQWAHEMPPAESRSMAGQAAEGDAVRGRELFEKRCTGCHAMTQNREGPRLQGVYGRASGDGPRYAYSPALKNARIVWNDASLDRWLADPDSLVPGNNMDFHVAKPQERRDLIQFLKQSAGS
jgi:cytochrome c